MLLRGNAEDKNHNPTLQFTWFISPKLFSGKLVFFVTYWLVYKWCWITCHVLYRLTTF